MKFFVCKAKHDNGYLYYPLTVISNDENSARNAFNSYLETENGEILMMVERPDTDASFYSHTLNRDVVKHNTDVLWRAINE